MRAPHLYPMTIVKNDGGSFRLTAGERGDAGGISTVFEGEIEGWLLCRPEVFGCAGSLTLQHESIAAIVEHGESAGLHPCGDDVALFVGGELVVLLERLERNDLPALFILQLERHFDI